MAWWQRQFGATTRGQLVALLRRGRRSVEELAAALGLTDNAVRAQLTALERDGLVSAAGVLRDGTVGKPATLYEVASGADTLFSSAYAPALAALVAELGERLPPRELDALLRGAGRRLAPRVASAPFDDRVRTAADLLAELGGEADLVETVDGYAIRAYGCPLARAVAACPATCHAIEQLLAEVTGAPVREQCDRTDALPRCRFAIPAPHSAAPPGGSRPDTPDTHAR
jgi:predicted ArsR family transcriptional regulator